MISISHYAKVKNKFCISYTGNYKEYKNLLLHFCKSFRNYYKCEIVLAVNKEFICQDSIDASSIQNYEFSHVEHIKIHPHKSTLLELIKDSPKQIFKIEKKQVDPYSYTICPFANYPNKDLPPESVSLLKNKIRGIIKIAKTQEEVDLNSNIIGICGEAFWCGFLNGCPTKLIPNGVDDDLYNHLTSLHK